MNSKFFFPALPGQSPDGDGYFGAFGGKFIPEALVAAVDEVAIEYERAKADPGFAAELGQLLAHYAGRPSVLTEIPRFARHAGGARVFLKREDLNHTGSHKIQQRTRTGPADHADGQAARHRGDGSRPARGGRQILERAGRLPDAAIACVGGGSNAIGLFHAFLPDTDVRLVGCEAAGHGVETGKHAATLSAGEPGILHGSRSYLLQDDEGQISEPWSISAGLDYPGVGPEHAYLHETGRSEYRPVTDAAAMRAFRLLASTEGIIPAIESAHALAGAIEVGTELGPDGLILVNLSGRGDKDMDTAARYFEQRADAARAGGAQR